MWPERFLLLPIIEFEQVDARCSFPCFQMIFRVYSFIDIIKFPEQAILFIHLTSLCFGSKMVFSFETKKEKGKREREKNLLVPFLHHIYIYIGPGS